VDTQEVIRNRETLNARGAGLVGLSNFGRDHFFALDAKMNMDIPKLLDFLEKYRDQQILIFGFTFMIWKYFYQALREANQKLRVPGGILIHSGGWKKMEEQAVTMPVFKSAFAEWCGITRIHNFYGMVEQVGSIYMECEKGYFHAPNFGEILIRDYRNWDVLGEGNEGVVQTLSILPRSYPGHSLLTEDLGMIHGIDTCACGRRGTYFTVSGRVPKAELRGCSDTHASEVQSFAS
jgi:hypothetical protein